MALREAGKLEVPVVFGDLKRGWIRAGVAGSKKCEHNGPLCDEGITSAAKAFFCKCKRDITEACRAMSSRCGITGSVRVSYFKPTVSH